MTTVPEAAQAFNLGNAKFREGRWAEALADCEQALQLDPGLEPAWLQKARCLVRLDRPMPAREAFAQTLRLNPRNYSAWLEAGHLCKQMGELAQAAMSYQRAIDVDASRYEALLGMARVLALQDQHAVSQRAYQDAVQAAQAQGAASVRQVHHLMGQYLLEMGQVLPAVRCLQQAIECCGADAVDDASEIQMDCAMALLRLGRREQALAMLSQASGAEREPTLARLAMLSFRNNLWQEAIEVSRRNVALHPESATALWNLAHLLSECWQMEEAEQVLLRAEALQPLPAAQALRAAMAGRLGDVDRTLGLYLDLARTQDPQGSYASSAAMSALYSDKLTPLQVAELHRQLFAPLGQGARPVSSFRRSPLAGRRLRVGLVSADFHHQHPVNIFMQPVLRELDRERFELFVYFTGDSHDDQTALARSRVAHWIEAATLTTAQLAKRIDADAIDVLVDLAGHTGQHRMRLFGQRAAPVQLTYLGYPGSTGVPNMDGIIGDAVVTPEAADFLCSEKVHRLPGVVFCFAPETDYPLPDFSSAMAQRPLTFASFNNVPKLTPRTLSLWARVLDAVPGSRLLLKAPSFSDPGAVRLFGDRLQALGVDLARVEFRGPVGLSDMMAEYADVDIALDPVPYNGGTTSLQAMWMGVPVLTQMGGHFVSRMGASFMTAAGLSDWVSVDDDDYVRIACAKAADRLALLELKRGLRARLQANPAWDVVAHTRALEAVWLASAGAT